MDLSWIESEVLRIVRELVERVGSRRALRALAPEAALERDLGLGSLERVELLLLLGDRFGVELPETVATEALTIRDLANAVARAGGAAAGPGAQEGAVPARVPLTPALPLAGRGGPREAAEVERHAGGGGLGESVDVEQHEGRGGPSEVRSSVHHAEARGGAAATDRGAPAGDPSSATTLVGLLLARAALTPDLPHVHLREEDGKEVTVTFRTLADGAAGIASGLCERGLSPGAPVALMLPTGADFFHAFFGVLLAGGIPLPLYPPHRADQIEEYAGRQAEILAAAEASLLVTATRTEGLASLVEARVPSLRGVTTAAELRRSPESFPVPRVRADSIALLQYTSGSTGLPKGVVLTHANLLANVRAISAGMGITAGDVVVSWLPLYHDMGLIGSWLGSLYAGVEAHVFSPLAFLARPQRWLWAMHEKRGTITAAPNFAYDLCARKIPERALEGLDLSSWRVALNGAEPVSPRTVDLFNARFAKYGFRPGAMFPAYGLAENAVALTFPPPGRGARLDVVERRRFMEEGVAAPAPASAPAVAAGAPLVFVGAGAAVAGSEVRVVDAEERPVAERRQGRIQFRGTSASPGYYKHPEATSAFVRGDGWRESGDLGYLADGELFVTGRSKDLVIKAGRNLAPQEVEDLAGSVQGVRHGSVAAFAAPGDDGTEALVVVAETRAQEAVDRERITSAIAERVVAALGVSPDRIVLAGAGAVPKTSSGKIRRAACREAYLRGDFEPQRGRRLSSARARAAWAFVVRADRGVRRTARSAAKLVYGLWVLGVLAGTLAPVWCALHLARPGASASALLRLWGRTALALAGLTPRVVGRERLPARGPAVLVSNHTSYLDVVVLISVLPGVTRMVAKADLAEGRLLGLILDRASSLFVRREDPRAGVEDAARVESRLAAGDTVLFFPEGTFTPATGVRPFKLGAFKAATATGALVVPLALRGIREVLRDLTWLPRFGPIEVRVGEPLRPQGQSLAEMARLRDLSREWMAAASGEPLLDLVRAGVPLEGPGAG